MRSGSGGDEAAAFAKELFEMYRRFAELKGWRFDGLTCSSIDAGEGEEERDRNSLGGVGGREGQRERDRSTDRQRGGESERKVETNTARTRQEGGRKERDEGQRNEWTDLRACPPYRLGSPPVRLKNLVVEVDTLTPLREEAAPLRLLQGLVA